MCGRRMDKFFDLSGADRKHDSFIRELPPYTDNGWRPPAYLPELRGALWIGIDTETKETDFDHGPGWSRGEGHIVGVSVAAVLPNGECGKWYFPVRHEVEREYNLDPSRVFDWLREQLSTSVPKIVANGIYDYGWLSTENIFPSGPVYDVQFAEALIDEDALTALDALGLKYLHHGKTVDLCKEWILKAYKGANKTNWRGFLWRTPPRLVGPYAEDDAAMPLAILPYQLDILRNENTLDLFDMECAQIPLLVRMRMGGVPVHLGYFEELKYDVMRETKDLYAKLSHVVGGTFDNVQAPSQMAKAFDVAGIQYPQTKLGKPSFRKEWLKALSEDVERDRTGIAKLVLDIREREKLVSTFIDGYILGRARQDRGSNGMGRIYCSFNPLRSDEGGAKTGRLSSSDPNLQNIPIRTALGKKVRKGFHPEYGHVGIEKKDYSQIEYRLFAHYAVGAGSDEMRNRYVRDPATDYHKDTQIDVAKMRGIDLSLMSEVEVADDRKPIKNVNFGLLYGQTEKSLAYKAGWTEEQATQFFAAYHAGRPFVRDTMKAITDEVQHFGYITTLLGRRTRFRSFEPSRFRDRVLRPDGKRMTYDQETATRTFGSAVKRAFAYRAVNYRFQGSAADVFKASMVRLYREGVFDFVGFPKLLVHDEMDWSRIDDSAAMNEAMRYVSHCMETTITCRVPLKVDTSRGLTWGDCK